MDLNEETFKGELANIVTNLQKILPKRNEILNVLTPLKRKLYRLKDVHADAKNVFPMCFTGAKVVVLHSINLNLMKNVKLSQEYAYGNPKEPFKSFTQMLHREMAPKTREQSLIIDTSPSVSATYREALSNGYEIIIKSKIQDLSYAKTELTFEKLDADYNGAVTWTMKNVDPGTIKFVSQWIQKVVPEVNVGMELGLKPFRRPFKPNFSISAKYEHPAFTLSSTISMVGFQICCFKQFEDVQISAILTEGNGKAASVGVALRKTFGNNSDVKVFVDSNGCGGVTYENKEFLNDNPYQMKAFSLIVSSMIDRQSRFRFGIGFNIDF